jgi:aspartyl/asparaginyl beta-hydroxylase (cupin superfamily)
MKLWFSITSPTHIYNGTEDEFVDIDNEPWAKELLQCYTDIEQELHDFVSRNEMTPYFHQGMINKKDTWKTIGLKFWDIEMRNYQKEFPTIFKWLDKHPEVVGCSFSKLEAESRILPHSGDTNGIYRVHLGFDIPEGLPRCGFRVRDELRPWQAGKFLAFIDAYNHEAWNETEKSRTIMLIDVIRPEFRNRKSFICKQVIAALALQKIGAILKISNHQPENKPKPMPFWVRKLLAKTALVGVYALLPLYKIGRKIKLPS